MPMEWNQEPSLWQRIVDIGPFWLVVGLAGLAGYWAARWIIVPRRARRDLGRADKLAQWRTWIGFGVVVLVSHPYRSFLDTSDDVLGNFNVSVPVSVGAYLLSIALFWLAIKPESRKNFWSELRLVFSRAATFFSVLAGSWLIARPFLSPQETPGEAMLGLVLLGWLVFLYSSGAYCISRYWFGVGRAHPLLPPIVTAETVCIMTAVSLHSGAPDGLPVKAWLLFNFAAVITTLCVCFIEGCDSYAEIKSGPSPAPGAASAKWPVVITAYAAIFALTFSVAFIWTGDAQRTLCAGKNPIVKCLLLAESH